MSFRYYVPTRALFGAGMLDRLHRQAMPGKKAMIVISNGKSARAGGYLARTEKQLQMAGVESVVFDKIQPNPQKTTVEEGGAFARENSCDFIVALGGGSVMDASKAIAVAATNLGDLWDYAISKTGKAMPIKNKPLPIIALPTTAGTGSETDALGVITKVETPEKIGFGFIDELFPKIAIIDPELTLNVPPKFTAYQGFDALFHSVEGYISKRANLMSDMMSTTAIKYISHNLPKVVHDGTDLDAREKVAFGSYLSGIVMVVGSTTSQHSLEHAMSAYHQELPHGAGLIMLSKAYFKFFIDKHTCDDRFIHMAKLMGKEDASKPEDFITMLVKLQEDCGVAGLKMSEYGIRPVEFRTLAKNAMDTMGRLFKNDRTPLSIEECIAIYEKSYK